MSAGISIMKAHGFTLIEILIAMVILGTASAGLIHMQISSTNVLSNSRSLTTAVTLAQDKMEQLKSLPCDHPDLADLNPGNNASLQQSTVEGMTDHGEDPVVIGDETTPNLLDMHLNTYKRCWNVADNTPCGGRKTVAVIVTWGPEHKQVAIASVL